MAESDGQEKTEQATGKRLSESRSQGQVAKSMEINTVAVIATGLFLLVTTKEYIGRNIGEFSTQIFRDLDKLKLTADLLPHYLFIGATFFFSILAPIFAGLIAISVIATVAQTGFNFSPKVLKPKLSRFNPIANFKNLIFSSRSLVELLKSIVKLAIISLFTFFVLESIIPKAMGILEYSVEDIVNFMVESAYTLLWKISLVYTILAASDFGYQKYKHKNQLMMTKQEVKEEMKSDEGDPQVKGRIRSLQRAAARKRMMKDIPTADVVITNPTHYAIALKYDSAKGSAPKVVAKGVDELAQRIKKIATENGVPLHEDRPLARALYKNCEVGDEIPASMFKAVAQILAYIFKLKNTKKKSIV